ncbi:MAG TPA: L,D-transpeptidase family protein [Sphingomicrobium sp.]|nr:L,D-transpeptidase family protein [Sphingomicrobium sp.]
MKQLALALAVTGALALGVPTNPATAAIETYEAKATAASAAEIARADMFDAFGPKQLKPGQYLWRDVPADAGEERVVISLSEQLAFLYRGETLAAVTTISTGTDTHPTPTGIFNVLEKKPMHHSRKYDNAPMPFMQRIDRFGVALHAGHNPGHPASHGCIRMPRPFAKKLFKVTDVGTPVLIGA